MKQRVQWIDIAKGIAILAVIVGHTLGPYTGDFWGSLIFAVHMPVFFILSGYLFRVRTFRQELTNGASKLLVPFVVTGGLVVFLSALAARLPANFILNRYFPSIRTGLLGALYGAGSEVYNPWGWHVQPIGAIWFLVSLFLALQLFNGWLRVTRHFSHVVFWQVAGIFLMTGLGGVLGKVAYLPWAVNAALLSQAFLYAGYLFKQYQVFERLPNESYLLWSFLWLLSAFQGYFVLTNASSPNLVISLLGGIAGSLCLFKVSQWLCQFQNKVTVSWLKRYGRESLVVLCFHLIDLDVIGIAGPLVKIVTSYSTVWLGVWAGIIYRISFATFWLVLMPKIPLLRSCYLPHSFPLKIRHIKKMT